MKMVKMVRTPAEKKARDKEMNKAIGPSGGEDLPYGLRVELDHDSLKKLGMHEGELPKVGSKLKLHALAHVGETSEHKRNGKGERRMTLHLHEMGLGEHADNEQTNPAIPSKAQDRQQKAGGMKEAMDKALGSTFKGNAEND